MSTGPAEHLNPCRELSFFQCTKIKLHDTNEDLTETYEKEEGGSPLDRNIDALSERMLECILGLDPDSRNMSSGVSTHEGGDEDDEDNEPDEINAMDIFLKLFLECDHIFRQIFLSHAAKCQLSLPLIVTNPRTSEPILFSLPYHSIFTQSYKIDKTLKQTKIIPIFTEKIYYISFIRFGMCTSSYKSKTLNSLLGIPNCFFHSETKGNSIPKVHFKGLVEINWFLPANLEGKKECFNEPLLFLNLRGNAFSFKKQLDFILDISTLVYIFISLEEANESELNGVEKILESYKHKVCLVIMDPKSAKLRRLRTLTIEENRTFYLISKYSNRANIPEHVIASMNGILKRCELPKMSLDVCKEVALKHDIHIDEDTEVTRMTIPFQEKIDQLFSDVLREKEELLDNLYLLKSELLPLQLEHWQKWASADREKSTLKGYKMGIECREAQMTKLRGTLNLARNNQIGYLINSSGPSEFFLTILKTICAHNVGSGMVYLWKILQTCLDRLSLEYMYPLNRRLTDNTCDESKQENAGLERARVTGGNALGIEHIMRELGQVYEIFVNARLKQNVITQKLDFNPSDLPNFAAKLILSGHSFEILDGSVTHIPLCWVSNVLKELSGEVGEDKRIFVIGILGIQSSGKSTLLNTMFGLQFPVKSGRCTRGIFMQIIPVDKSTSEKLGYHYLVVLDTEGLGAPELMEILPASHDNELATFVTGMSDLVIVNLFGEDQAKFKDILQITILALMKMQLTSAKPVKCVFVHQNVTDINASENLSVGKEQLIKLLDNTTVHAAKLEGFPDYTKFADVIDYNVHLDTYYIPGLYSSNPPMSVVSSDYSARCETLKRKITQEYCRNIKFQSVSTWTQKLKDIWNSLLSQKFILKYKTILECCAAFEFDDKLTKWRYQYDADTLDDLNKTIVFISNAELKDIDSVYNVSKNLIGQWCREAANKLEERTVEHLFQKSEYKDIQQEREKDAKKYFDSTRYQKQASLQEQIELHFKQRKDVLKIEAEFNRIREVILKQAKEDIIRLNEKGDWPKPNLHLEILFDRHWCEWDSTLSKNCESLPVDIESDLQAEFRYNSVLANFEISKESRELLVGDREKFDDIRLLDFHFGSSHFKIFIPGKEGFISPNCTFTDFYDYSLRHNSEDLTEAPDNSQEKISKIIQIISSLCQEFLHSLDKSVPYSNQSFTHLINIVCGQAAEFNDKEKSDIIKQIVLTELFMYEFSFYICCKGVAHLKMLQRDFHADTNAAAQLLNLKKELKPIFIQLCQGTQTNLSCARALAEIVFAKMVNYLESKLRTDIIPYFQNDLKNRDTFKRRSSLQLRILRELATRKDFDQYIAYIDDPINFIRNWIETKFKLYCEDKVVQKEIRATILDPTINKLKQSYIAELKSSIEESKSDWKSIFYQKINSYSKELRRSDFDILDVYQNPVNHEEDFIEFFTRSFDDMYSPFGWLGWIHTTINNALYTNTRYLTKLLVTCQSLCPFCKEPCLMSSEGHRHYCGSLHRPKGLVGYFHETSNTFSIRECTHSMNTDHIIVYNNQRFKYTDYKRINPHFASWKILGEDAANSNYWQWVFYHFRFKFVHHYGYTYNPDVEHWADLTEEEVLIQLDLLYERFLNRIERSHQ